jgi:hypothetical protein
MLAVRLWATADQNAVQQHLQPWVCSSWVAVEAAAAAALALVMILRSYGSWYLVMMPLVKLKKLWAAASVLSALAHVLHC